MFGRIFLAMFSILVLGGCAGTGARVITEGVYLIDAASDYVHENHALRRWVRGKCFELLQQRIKKLDQDGDIDGANELLISSYPPVVTLGIIKNYKNDSSSLLSIPFGCYTHEDEPKEN